MGHLFLQGDAGRIPLPDRSVDLVIGSMPYLEARLYLENGRNLGVSRKLDAWVSWMLRVTDECLRVSKGAVIWVVAGSTRDRTYQPGPERLMSEWLKGVPGSGVWQDGIELPLRPPGSCSMYRPCYFHRVGIPGSGGDQWFRADVEYICCFKRPGKLPYANNTACGHTPKWAPGGTMSHRISDGTRRNQWGGGEKSTSTRNPAGKRQRTGRPSHVYAAKSDAVYLEDMKQPDATVETQGYRPPVLANPGNVLKCIVGGNLMGHPSSHLNEAPFPSAIPDFYIKSLCHPGGIVLDPFSGSGTSVESAERLGRIGIGMDLRMSQCLIGKDRLEHPHAPRPKKARKPKPEYVLFD